MKVSCKDNDINEFLTLAKDEFLSSEQQPQSSPVQTKGRELILSSLKMAVATFSSRILGLVREQVMAAVFGASGITDAFLVAYRIPNLLRDLFAEGAFSAAFVPIFTEVLQIDKQKARALLWSLLILLLVVTGILSVGMILFAQELLVLFAPKFEASDELARLTVILIQIMAPFLSLVSVAALFMGALNALKVFFIPSFAPVFFNIMMIGSVLILPPFLQKYGYHSVLSLGIGVVLGGLAQIVFQVPMIFKKGFGPSGPIILFSGYTKKILNRVGVGTIGIAATQINVLISTILATSTVVGAVSWLSYSFRLFQFPVGILGVSIAGSNLVHFGHAWKKGQKVEAIEILKQSYSLSLMVMIPSMAILSALSKESVQIVFEHGAFQPHDTLMTTLALNFYLIGLPFYGLYKIFVPVFYTLDRPGVPVIISIISIMANIVFCLWATPIYGFQVLALGTALSMFVNTILQGTFLSKNLKLSFSFFINLRVIRILGCGLFTYFAIDYGRFFVMRDSLPMILKLGALCGLIVMGFLFYGLSLFALGESRRKIFVFVFLKRLFRSG